MIGVAVAILAWIRWRDSGETVALYESSAFVALTTINTLMIAIVIVGREGDFGLAASQPGAAPIYLWTLTRGTVAAILVIGAARSLRREPPPLPPSILVIVPALVLVLAGVMLFGREASLPPVPGAEAFDPNGPGVLGVSPLSTADRAPAGRDLCRLHRRRDPPPTAVRPLRARVRRLPVRGLGGGCLQPAALRARPGGRLRDRDFDRCAAACLLRDPGDGHPGGDRWRLRGPASRQRRAEPSPRGGRRERDAGRTHAARARDPRRPRPGPVVRQAQAGPADPEREPRSRTRRRPRARS